MLKEFREFAMKGNVVDLAIGVIIGAAFGKIVESLVGDMIMPVFGAITGGLDFSNYFLPLAKSVTADRSPRPEAGRGAGLGQFRHHRDQFRDRRVRAVLRREGINRLKKSEEEKVRAENPAPAGNPAGRNPRPAQGEDNGLPVPQ